MSVHGVSSKLMHAERGAVLVMVAVWMSSGIALVTFVIDAGHWFEHNRHLQLQVDAGALAGAGSFNGCFSANKAAANQAIENAARKYSGATNSPPTGATGPTGPPVLNAQVNNKQNVTVVVNSQNYPNNGGADNTDPAGQPCQAGYIDVKAADTNLPWLFAKQLVPATVAHARVSILQVASLGGSLPLAVRDVNPLDVGAIFINEGSGNAVLGRQDLTAGTNQLLNGVNVTGWTGGPVSVSIPSGASQVGVVIALCSNAATCGPSKGTAWLTSGSVAAVCGELYVQCWNNGSSGLDFIQGYSTTGTGTAAAPILRSVTLTPGNCTDNSAPYFLLNGGCKLGVQAQLDFGITTNPATALSATVSVGACNLSYSSSTGTTSTWSASTCLTVASGAGQAPQTLSWSTGTGRGHPTGTFANVARPFANDGPTDTQSYPVAYMQVSQGASCASGLGNSVPYGAATNFCVGVGTLGNLRVAADTTDPTQILKFIGSNGSHSGAINCGGTNLYADIVGGCTNAYKRNTGESCPNTTIPADCALIRTGQKVGQVRQGMNDRFVPSSVCPANNWSLYPNIPSGDPRAVPVIITLSDAFDGSGSGYVPVTDFASFYVTGWDGDSAVCSGINEAAPAGAGNGTIWGHFITYVGDLGSSTGGSTCTFTASLSPCIPVLTD